MKIIVDAMGGDHAPQATVRGALDAHRSLGVEILLVGRSADILKEVENCGETTLPAGVEIRNATEVVEISDDAAFAFKEKKNSSLTVGLTLLRDGLGDAFVSAGSTGALLSGATLVTKRIRGIRRAAMAPQIPCLGGHVLLCDCGANAECTPEYLIQFAYLGSFYARNVMKLENPRVGLLNIGAEKEKGDAMRREVYAALTQADAEGRIRFIGNVEASAAMQGGADVVVSDGFSGNVMLKSVEGAGKFLSSSLKELFLSRTRTKLAALLIQKEFAAFRDLLDPNSVGGTPFLGISKPVIKAHGGSDARGIRNAIRQAQEFAASGFIADVEQNIEYMRLSDPAGNPAEKA
ncbi:MAG: phosphate acyltransferase PlsX [Oscillibacter sp.]|jgi:glycerol-3-phosphate acyltransferase PlsX|nr:phosphate acyltransferase PlsX [Oscillibacter sp.]